ncbi:hypothetical protein EGW08_008089 [Elysia chlorotica]|uniref:Tyrosine-protein kinase ephrin type A/B receptor-like domain-containing protein n=1 Tax=Elysia chlorotica TaxID=188477 RepID=A0A3S0ZVR7_ELYCH|nr:hypothetical protein EGW08_008089 [Elysia chlorotica]
MNFYGKYVIFLLLHAEAALVPVHLGNRTVIRHCINFPHFIPLNAVFSVRGSFQARLKCLDPNQDISLDTVELKGILICRPFSDINYDFYKILPPECKAHKIPAEIRITNRFIYNVRDCRSETIQSISALMTDRTQTYITNIDKPCGEGQRTCQSNFDYLCGISEEEHKKGYPYQLEVHNRVLTEYQPKQGLEFYRQLAQDIRNRVGCDESGQLLPDNRHKWENGLSHLVNVYVSSWVGTCSEHLYTRGTDLEVDGVLTCRGCPGKHYLYYKQCRLCEYGEYSKPPANKCMRCPHESLWTDTEKMEDLCFVRP